MRREVFGVLHLADRAAGVDLTGKPKKWRFGVFVISFFCTFPAGWAI